MLGVSSLLELIGRVDLLEVLPGRTARQQQLDLSPILHRDALLDSKPQYCQVASNTPFDKGELAERMVDDILPAIENSAGGHFEYTVSNCDRTIGARLSGEIARRHGNQGMADTPIKISLSGVAGQSLGAWNAGGLELYLSGDANDYVGKGMAGGKIILSPPPGSQFASHDAPIMGNTCLYGATGGKLFAAGRAGERFGVRNSGAYTVVEGAGDHCCEYMTGGVVVVLGSTGHNFGAGMTGGFSYVLDMERDFYDRVNTELVEVQRITQEALENQRSFLRHMIEEFVQETGSERGRELAENFDDYVAKFWLVKPKSATLASLFENTRGRPE
jgi:glutamate synthase (NADPH/NADH) large chain